MIIRTSLNLGPLMVAAMLFTNVTQSNGQQVQRCHTDEMFDKLLLTHPEAQKQKEEAHARALQYIDQHSHSRNTQATVVIVPVVVHVMHLATEPIGLGRNISDAQIKSQIDVLNEDYRRLNPDTGSVPAIFKSRAADVGIEFRLATVDPQGNPTDGIDRRNTGSVTAFVDGMKDSTSWDHNSYMNLWVGDISGGLLGYTTFPNSTSATQDGVVIGYKYFGRGFSTTAPFNKGRTATHEIGHFFGLEHTFQGGCGGNTAANCANGGDGICDTPPTTTANYGCPSNTLNSCTETPTDERDMWMNYMDYVDDGCMYMFSKGQVDVMNGVLQTERPGLVTSTAALPQNFFAFNGKVVDAQTQQGVPSAKVLFLAGAVRTELVTDVDGNFSTPNFRQGNYDIYAAKWGYGTTKFALGAAIDSATSSFIVPIHPHQYYDDFIIDEGWTANTTASSGAWVIGAPVATNYNGAPANPGVDASTLDFGDLCYVTGNGGGQAGNDDVDNGATTLVSPVFDISGFTLPILNYSRWFYNAGGQNGDPLNDTMTISITNGTDTVVIEKLSATDNANNWTTRSYHIADLISPSATMKLLVTAADNPNGNIVEGGFDMFRAYDSLAVSGINSFVDDMIVKLWPNPTHGMFTLALNQVADGKVLVTVCNTSGQEVLRREMTSNNEIQLPLDLSAHAPGVYMVKIQTTGGSLVKRIVRL